VIDTIENDVTATLRLALQLIQRHAGKRYPSLLKVQYRARAPKPDPVLAPHPE
jgi:hypothetical protein